MWEWHDDEFDLQDDTILDIPKSIWNDLGESEESLSFDFNDITPAKACGDLGYHNTNSGDMSSSKRIFADNTEEREKHKLNSSQAKRRRMLQFESEALPVPYCNEEMLPTSLEEKGREDTLEEVFSNISQWVSGGDTSSSGHKGLNQASEGWPANCLNDDEIQFNSNNVDRTGASKAHNAGSFKTLPVEASEPVQKRRPRSRQNVVFKGKKSYMQTSTKATSSVVYPFSIIKPCGVNGDMTIKDINQRICTPPPKQKEDVSSIYPTSAFSGKPVVNQMKIHTEGGKGCITIMRTKG